MHAPEPLLKYQNLINREYLIHVFLYQVYQTKLLERLLTSRGLPSDSTYVRKAVPGKLDVIGSKPDILFISLPTDSLFKLAIMTLFSIFVLIQRHSKSATSS